jgi:hypothetical protein
MSALGANPSARSGDGVTLGLRANWQQFSLLVLINVPSSAAWSGCRPRWSR